MKEDCVGDLFATNEYQFTSDLAGKQACATAKQSVQWQTAKHATDPLATNPLPETMTTHNGAAKATSD